MSMKKARRALARAEELQSAPYDELGAATQARVIAELTKAIHEMCDGKKVIK